MARLYNAAQLMPNRWPDLFLNSEGVHRDNRECWQNVMRYKQPSSDYMRAEERDKYPQQ